jgi:hypothetical protein
LVGWIQIRIWIQLLVLFLICSNLLFFSPLAFPFLAWFLLQPVSSKSAGAPLFLWPASPRGSPAQQRGPADPTSAAPSANHSPSHSRGCWQAGPTCHPFPPGRARARLESESAPIRLARPRTAVVASAVGLTRWWSSSRRQLCLGANRVPICAREP